MAHYEEDLNNDIDDDNKKANHSDNNDIDSIQYVIAVHLFNKSFMYLLTAKDSFLSSKPSIA